MYICPFGNLRLAWEAGHPLNALFRHHYVLAATAWGDTAIGLLLVDEGYEEGQVGTLDLYDGDYVFHSGEACGAGVSASGHVIGSARRRVSPVSQFWVTDHPQAAGRRGATLTVTGVRCPGCGLEYVTDRDTAVSEATLDVAAQALSGECPAHDAWFTM